jgi:mono/diheme cytochrome c family protein
VAVSPKGGHAGAGRGIVKTTKMKIMLWLAGAAMLLVPAAASAQDAKLVEAGKKIYDAQGCAKCHQIAGKGAKLSVLDGVGSKLTAEELRLWLSTPDEMMAKLPKKPVVKMKKVELKDPDLDALVAYLQSLKKQ